MCSTDSRNSDEWINQLVNRLPSHATSYSYQSTAEALSINREQAKVVSLNGVWKLRFANYVDEATNDFYKLYFYDICDKYGLYIIGEANIETHDSGGRLSNDHIWSLAFMERITRMIVCDKDHHSIVYRSIGNESCGGLNHVAMAG